jgi:hypothetical protein
MIAASSIYQAGPGRIFLFPQRTNDSRQSHFSLNLIECSAVRRFVAFLRFFDVYFSHTPSYNLAD